MNERTAAKKPVNDWILDQTKYVVQSGPFKDMILLPEKSWDDGNTGCMSLGCYEQELHPAIEREIKRLAMIKSPKIINIGCAEGFYAVGLARRIPHATVYAIDIEAEAERITLKAAQANGVTNVVGKEVFSVDTPSADLIVSDCEGAELDYLDPTKSLSLVNAVLIIECHDRPGRAVTQPLIDRFKPTHSIEMIREGARDPNEFQILWPLHSLDRWAAVSEGRPCLMHWLVMIPHQPKAPE